MLLKNFKALIVDSLDKPRHDTKVVRKEALSAGLAQYLRCFATYHHFLILLVAILLLDFAGVLLCFHCD
jgi:hypothetical protein